MTNRTCGITLAGMDIQNAYNEWPGIYDSNQNLTRDLEYRHAQDAGKPPRLASFIFVKGGHDPFV